MVLSSEQIQDILKSPKSKANLQKAIDHENRLKFHADISSFDVITSDYKSGLQARAIADLPYYQKYILWIQTFLTANDKYEQFLKLLTFPLKTNEIVDSIADEYVKVFDAQDSYFNIEFLDPNLKDDFNEYLQRVNDVDFWHDTAFKAMLSSVSSIIIIDLAAEQTTERPEPYYYLLDICKVHDIDVDRDGNINYLAFTNEKGQYALFDGQYYRIFEKDNQGNYHIIAEVPHPLQYCPAKFLWHDVLKKSNPLVKHSPISSLLSRLDWLLFFETAKEALDIYAAYPIYWAYQSKCDYRDSDGRECTDGFISFYDTSSSGEKIKPCPVCESKKIVGPGSLLEKPVPRGDIRIEGDPAGIISIDKASLEYNRDEVERLKAQIITAATGKMKVLQKEAINEDQVASQYESQTNILNWIARNFEKANKWVTETVCTLRYGDQFVNVALSYGTRFYLQSLDDAINDFQTAKSAGLPNYILYSKVSVIEHLQARNNPKEELRLNILKNLEPYPYMTMLECKTTGIDLIDKEGFVLKANFANFVSKFEMEFGSILEFGSKLPFATKIDRIVTKLNDYARARITISEPPLPDGGTSPTVPGQQAAGTETGKNPADSQNK